MYCINSLLYQDALKILNRLLVATYILIYYIFTGNAVPRYLPVLEEMSKQHDG